MNDINDKFRELVRNSVQTLVDAGRKEGISHTKVAGVIMSAWVDINSDIHARRTDIMKYPYTTEEAIMPGQGNSISVTVCGGLIDNNGDCECCHEKALDSSGKCQRLICKS